LNDSGHDCPVICKTEIRSVGQAGYDHIGGGGGGGVEGKKKKKNLKMIKK